MPNRRANFSSTKERHLQKEPVPFGIISFALSQHTASSEVDCSSNSEKGASNMKNTRDVNLANITLRHSAFYNARTSLYLRENSKEGGNSSQNCTPTLDSDGRFHDGITRGMVW